MMNNYDNIYNLKNKTFSDLDISDKSDLNNFTIKNYLIFSLYSVNRAIPNIISGLKLVQKRILYAMYINKFFSDKKFVKSIKSVAAANSSFHPHGDIGIYTALVTMAQDFKNILYNLVDKQGNFGSVASSAAQSRYTEVRLSKISMNYFRNIEKNIVTFIDNFDNTTKEPLFLPAELPFSIINGNYGISVGMIHSSVSHNLKEVIDAIVFVIDNPNASLEQIMQFIKGPDFTTGCDINIDDLYKIYSDGTGSLLVQATIKIIENKKNNSFSLEIDNFPVGVNIETVLNEIWNLRETVFSVINKSYNISGKFAKLLLKIKKNTTLSKINNLVNQLFKFTSLRKYIYINNCYISKDGLRIYNLKDKIDSFIKYKFMFVKKRIFFEISQLNKMIDRNNLFLWINTNSKKITKLLIEFNDKKLISNELKLLADKTVLKFGDKLLDIILELPIKRISLLEKNILEEKRKDLLLNKKIKTDILNNKDKLISFIKEEILELSKPFYTKRLSTIRSFLDLNNPVNFEENCNFLVCIIDRKIFVKIRTDKIDVKKLKQKPIYIKHNFTGCISHIKKFNNLDSIFFVTKYGYIFKKNIFQLNMIEDKKIFSGDILSEYLNEKNDEIVEMVKIDNNFEYLGILTKFGRFIKISLNSLITTKKKNYLKLVALSKGDSIACCRYIESTDDTILCSTNNGKILKVNINLIPLRKRGAKGVKVIKIDNLKTNFANFFTSFNSINEEKEIVVLDDKYYSKRISIDEIRYTNRNTKGINIVKKQSKLLYLNKISSIPENNILYLLNNDNKVLAFDVFSIKNLKRTSRGRKVWNIKYGKLSNIS